MFGSTILEVAIGIVFIFTIFSSFCVAIREGIEAWFKSRAAHLEFGIRELLGDPSGKGLARELFTHPLIYGLFSGDYKCGQLKKPGSLTSGKNLPSYIPAKNFATALIDIVARGPVTDTTLNDATRATISLQSIRENATKIENPVWKRVFLNAIDMSQGDLNRVQSNIEAWYDSSMDRVSGWYKRSTQNFIFWLGLLLAGLFNVDTLSIMNTLYHDSTARQVIIGQAATVATDPKFLDANYDKVKTRLKEMSLPIGWPGPPSISQVVSYIPGWFLTAIASMLGAPFWFDILNKMMVVRSTVKPHEKSPEESSEDRQNKKDRDQGKAKNLTESSGITGPQGEESIVVNPNGADAIVLGNSIVDTSTQIDGCEVGLFNPTADKDLPAAEGGVLT
jgi:hypothetical protein